MRGDRVTRGRRARGLVSGAPGVLWVLVYVLGAGVAGCESAPAALSEAESTSSEQAVERGDASSDEQSVQAALVGVYRVTRNGEQLQKQLVPACAGKFQAPRVSVRRLASYGELLSALRIRMGVPLTLTASHEFELALVPNHGEAPDPRRERVAEVSAAESGVAGGVESAVMALTGSRCGIEFGRIERVRATLRPQNRRLLQLHMVTSTGYELAFSAHLPDVLVDNVFRYHTLTVGHGIGVCKHLGPKGMADLYLLQVPEGSDLSSGLPGLTTFEAWSNSHAVDAQGVPRETRFEIQRTMTRRLPNGSEWSKEIHLIASMTSPMRLEAVARTGSHEVVFLPDFDHAALPDCFAGGVSEPPAPEPPSAALFDPTRASATELVTKNWLRAADVVTTVGPCYLLCFDNQEVEVDRSLQKMCVRDPDKGALRHIGVRRCMGGQPMMYPYTRRSGTVYLNYCFYWDDGWFDEKTKAHCI
jgi:hypothetical protein